MYYLGYLKWKMNLPDEILTSIKSAMALLLLRPLKSVLTLVLGSSVTAFGQRLMLLSSLLLYLSFIYLAVITGGYIIDQYGFHIGLWSGIAFGSLVSLIFGYLVVSMSIRIRNNVTQ